MSSRSDTFQYRASVEAASAKSWPGVPDMTLVAGVYYVAKLWVPDSCKMAIVSAVHAMMTSAGSSSVIRIGWVPQGVSDASIARTLQNDPAIAGDLVESFGTFNTQVSGLTPLTNLAGSGAIAPYPSVSNGPRYMLGITAQAAGIILGREMRIAVTLEMRE